MPTKGSLSSGERAGLHRRRLVGEISAAKPVGWLEWRTRERLGGQWCRGQRGWKTGCLRGNGC